MAIDADYDGYNHPMRKNDETITSIANRLFNDPAYTEYIQRRFIESRRYKKTELYIDPEWNSYSLDKLRWQPSHNSEEHLQPKAPEKIPEGWE